MPSLDLASAPPGEVAPPPEVVAYARGYTCPDCLADRLLQHDAAGIWRLYVRHDDTCPNLARIEGRRRP